MTSKHRVIRSIQKSIAVKELLLKNTEVISVVAKVSELLVDALQEGNKVILFGNGGSAADAQHIAAEFVGRFAFDRPALPALALSVNTSCVTAIGNDYGFDLVFSRQIEALAHRGDVADRHLDQWPVSRTCCGRCRRRRKWVCTRLD